VAIRGNQLRSYGPSSNVKIKFASLHKLPVLVIMYGMRDSHPVNHPSNIFADLGLKNAEELRARSDLMSEVVSIIRNSELTQKEIAEILGISPPKVSALMTGKINDFSNDTLVTYLTMLGCNVEIRVLHRCPVSTSVKKGEVSVKKHTIRKKRTIVRKKITKAKA